MYSYQSAVFSGCHFATDNFIPNVPTHLSHSAIFGQPTPLEITIQAGEFEVLKSIFQTSIPYLLGWNTTMDIASAAAMSRGISGQGYGQGY